MVGAFFFVYKYIYDVLNNNSYFLQFLKGMIMTEELHEGGELPVLNKDFEDLQQEPVTLHSDEPAVVSTKDELFAPPRDAVTLPSLGKVYPIGSPLHNAEYVQVRHLTAADEDILTSRSLLRTGKAIDTLLANCLIDKTINPEDLLSGDKNAILTYLRVSGYGPEYKVEISCPGCAEDINYEFDMSVLEMNPLSLEPTLAGENCFDFVMPSGTNIEFKFLNSAEEKEISDTQEKIKKKTNSPIDKNVTTRLKQQIISLNGNSDLTLINDYVDNMPVRDSRSFRSYLEKHNPDVIMKQSFNCTHCGDSQEVDIPISVSFFWPDTE